MKRSFLIPSIILILCSIFAITSCGGSSTGSGNGGNGTDEAPSSPANLHGNSGDQKIDLSWDANSENDLSGYNLYRSTSSFSDISDMTPVNASDLIQETNSTDSGLENGTTYYYRLTAVDENDNESGTSNQLEITPFSDPPDRPE